ncbi:MAG: T9SS type A sorting domain-containing protein, partial [Bacteroidales bacterium]|nr:T9SS type A sorting domain-containing protein [Bacteroidales bacterium]
NFSVDENESYTLDGSLSHDADNDPLTFQWTAPPEVTLSSDTVASPSFTAPSVVRDSVLEFSLVVNDGSKDSDPDIVRATVINLDSLSRETYIDSVYMAELDSFALDTAAALVTLYLPYGTDTRSLSPGFTLARGASISPPSESTHEFTMPYYYNVTAEDGITSQMWKVEVHRPEKTVQRSLDAGWNWISLNVQPADPAIDSVFAAIAPTELDYIKSAAYSSVFYNSTDWFGNLDVFPQQGVLKYNKAGAEVLSVTGREINPATTPISLVKGWNDLPYLLRSDEAIDNALDSNTLPSGDILVKGREGSALYIQGSGWTGELDSLRVLHGYRINVASAGTAKYSVTEGDMKVAQLKKNGSDATGINRRKLLESYGLQPSQYEYSATLIAKVMSANGKQFISEGDRLIAHADGEVRGVSQADRIQSTGECLFVLTYYANSEEEHVTFSIQTSTAKEAYGTDLSLAFEADAITGTAFEPQVAVAPKMVVGTGEQHNNRIAVYPNPAKDHIMVKSAIQIKTVRVYDLAGKLLLQENIENDFAKIHLQEFQPGVYTLKVGTAGETMIRKIIITSH